MSIQRAVALSLVVSMTVGAAPALLNAAAQSQGSGLISGKASEQAKKPYSDYTVLLRDVATGQVVSTVPLGQQGEFAFSGLATSKRYLVELFQTKTDKIVCTEGPYALSATLLTKTDVNINCGGNPAVWYIVAAGAGTAAAIAFARRSSSK